MTDPDTPHPPPKHAAGVRIRPHGIGDLGYVVHRHAVLYHQDHGFDASFEVMVARVAADFIAGYDPQWDCARIAEIDGRIAGSAVVVRGPDRVAKLRLVYLEPSARGAGLGRQLVDSCMTFARGAGYTRMTLATLNILLPARRLYASLGFARTSAVPIHAFGRQMLDETWERDL